MTAVTTPPQLLDLPRIRRAVDTCLNDFLASKAATAAEGRMPAEITDTLGAFLQAGGKRIRPLLCVLGWCTAGGTGPATSAVQAGAALEMFHAFCLIHDDVMDHSDTRRGRPTVHRALATHHTPRRTPQAADEVGAGAAILIGDLALVWSDELLHCRPAGLGADQLARVRPLIDLMRTEVMYGQYLDLTATGRPTSDVDRALRIIRYKTAKYTCERPLHIGAALAGADDTLLHQLSDFALPLGEAFQLRDDLLGVFGNPAATGKPHLDDLRDGKHTVLIALALQRATPTQRKLLHSLVGSPDLDDDGAAQVRDALAATGARDLVERLIRARTDQAQRALDRGTFPRPAAAALRELAHAATARAT